MGNGSYCHLFMEEFDVFNCFREHRGCIGLAQTIYKQRISKLINIINCNIYIYKFCDHEICRREMNNDHSDLSERRNQLLKRSDSVPHLLFSYLLIRPQLQLHISMFMDSNIQQKIKKHNNNNKRKRPLLLSKSIDYLKRWQRRWSFAPRPFGCCLAPTFLHHATWLPNLTHILQNLTFMLY